MFFGSPLVIAYVVSGALLWNLLVRPWKERDMETQFGEDFRVCKRAVRCWMPRVRPYFLNPKVEEVAMKGQSME